MIEVLALLVPLLVVVVLAGGARLHRGPPPTAPATVAADRVLVVSGSYGAGHDAAAREVRRCLEADGHVVEILDVALLFPLRLGEVLRRAYFAQLDAVPTSWRLVLRALERRDGAGGALASAATGLLSRLPARRLLAAVPPGTVAVISTHPFASLALGRLRRTGRLAAPVTTYLTDASVHRLWVADGVDRHVAIHPEAERQARARGAADVRLVQPLVKPAAVPPSAAGLVLRRAWDVPAERPVALAVGGAEGVGDLEAAARDLRDTGLVTPVVVCGRNDDLRRRLAEVRGVLALGWLDGLTEAIAASDLVVHNAGGFTTLEALHLRRPLVSYRCLPGHGEENARALEADGLAAWPRTKVDLAGVVAEALAGAALPASPWHRRDRLVDALDLLRPAVAA